MRSIYVDTRMYPAGRGCGPAAAAQDRRAQMALVLLDLVRQTSHNSASRQGGQMPNIEQVKGLNDWYAKARRLRCAVPEVGDVLPAPREVLITLSPNKHNINDFCAVAKLVVSGAFPVEPMLTLADRSYDGGLVVFLGSRARRWLEVHCSDDVSFARGYGNATAVNVTLPNTVVVTSKASNGKWINADLENNA